MNQYRDFDNDAVRYNYDEGKKLLAALHEKGQHYMYVLAFNLKAVADVLDFQTHSGFGDIRT